MHSAEVQQSGISCLRIYMCVFYICVCVFYIGVCICSSFGTPRMTLVMTELTALASS